MLRRFAVCLAVLALTASAAPSTAEAGRRARVIVQRRDVVQKTKVKAGVSVQFSRSGASAWRPQSAAGPVCPLFR